MRSAAAATVLLAALTVTHPAAGDTLVGTPGCGGLATLRAAQAFLEAHPGDVRGLDPDGNGRACDSDDPPTPAPVTGSTRRTSQEPGGADLPWWAWTAVSAGVVWLLTRSLRTPRRR